MEHKKLKGFLSVIGGLFGMIIAHLFRQKKYIIRNVNKLKELEKAQEIQKLKILVVCQYYKPEPFRISDTCEELVKRGHEVTVLAGIPNYPEGIIYTDYKNCKKRDEIINGVRVCRCFTFARKKGIIYRFLNYYSFALSSSMKVLLNKIKAKDGTEFDVVFVNQLSPVMMAYAGLAYKSMHHKKLVMYCLDLWPESLVAGGIKRDSLVYCIFHIISEHIYRNCDQILVTSRMFINYLVKEFKIDENKIDYLPQYAEDIFNNISNEENEKDTIDFVFAGNIGEVQSVETIIEAAKKLKCDDFNMKITFHIIGSGTDIERLKELSEGLDNIVFYGRKPVEDMPKYYELADAMLITLSDDPILSMTLPGKVQSYMAAGKPIIGAIDGETSAVIQESKCGFVGKAKDYEKLVENIKKFIDLKYEDRLFLGENARLYYEENFAGNIYMNQMEYNMKKQLV